MSTLFTTATDVRDKLYPLAQRPTFRAVLLTCVRHDGLSSIRTGIWPEHRGVRYQVWLDNAAVCPQTRTLGVWAKGETGRRAAETIAVPPPKLEDADVGTCPIRLWEECAAELNFWRCRDGDGEDERRATSLTRPSRVCGPCS